MIKIKCKKLTQLQEVKADLQLVEIIDNVSSEIKIKSTYYLSQNN